MNIQGQKKQRLSVFEHETLKVGEKGFTHTLLKVLQSFYGDKGTPYYSLIHNGVKFSDYVGVLQIRNVTIEVLPKIDKMDTDESKWQGVLISMLKQASILKVKSSSSTNLKLKSNSILELYFELFINECEYLLHRGLIKQYRKAEGNLHALKGSLIFSKHLVHNLAHQESFYTRHTTYDYLNTYNKILYKTLYILRSVNTSSSLQSRINRLILIFPELLPLEVNENTFQRLYYNRKTESYKSAIDIARLILLNYHPDIVRGQNHVLALMFSMNRLWEVWVLRILRRELHPKGFVVESQISEKFWDSKYHNSKYLKPDLIITGPKGERTIIDTKWKAPAYGQPSDNDLRQIFAYLIQFKSAQGILLYPGTEFYLIEGKYVTSEGTCNMLHVPVVKQDLLDYSSMVNCILKLNTN